MVSRTPDPNVGSGGRFANSFPALPARVLPYRLAARMSNQAQHLALSQVKRAKTEESDATEYNLDRSGARFGAGHWIGGVGPANGWIARQHDRSGGGQQRPAEHGDPEAE